MTAIIEVMLITVALNLILGFYVWQRLNSQDKYLTTFMQAFASHKDITLPPVLNSTEIKEDRKPEVYSPRHDPETIMKGHVIDPFD